MSYPSIQCLIDRLGERLASPPPATYRVPGRWLDASGPPEPHELRPERFYHRRLNEILKQPPSPRVTDGGIPGDWSKNAVVYNLLVRYGAAFDHDGDGRISPEPLASGWRETGTFLKAITLLPFIRSLGCNTVHLLPIADIGGDGNKGDMGSAFAIRDPFKLDEHLSEPALGLGAEAEFAAFMEAAHHLGLRVVVEFVFRTASKDAAWVREHPEWFYWIRADIPDRRPGEATETAYGPPVFSGEELRRVQEAVGAGRAEAFPPPHAIYRQLFTPPPPADTVHLNNGQWRGVATEPGSGRRVEVRIPGAFCDWPLDSSQPPWTDVTYLRLYDHPDYNYIAYNTVRMYAAELARPEHIVEPLWERIADVIPHYQTRFGVDGVMIDMGHALPADLKRRMVARAREVNPDFALWAEDFGLNPAASEEGYNLCLGPFLQTVRDEARWRDWLRWLHETGVPVVFMATPENHNTPRAVHWPGGRAYALYAQAMGAFLPGAPYVHNGFELAEDVPVNTGFDFTPEEAAEWPAERLPLFSAAAMDWTRRDTLIEDIRRIHAVRAQHAALCAESAPGTLVPLETANPSIAGYMRRAAGYDSGLAVVGNCDLFTAQPFTPPHARAGDDLLTGAPLPDHLQPGQVVVYAC